jgi:hypothetical protein
MVYKYKASLYLYCFYLVCKINSMHVFYMSSTLEPAPVDSNSTTTSQQSAGMAHGDTPANNAYEQQQSDGNNQADMNSVGGRRSHRRRRRPVKSKKSKRRRHKSIRRKSTRRRSRRMRGRKGRKGMKSKKRMRGGGGSPCGAGFVLADVTTPIYPDRSGGDQTVAAQTTLAQTNGMNMDAQSKLDAQVPNPQ